MISRRRFLQLAALSAVPRGGRPRGCEFVFARLRYESGDWDYNPKVAANVLDSDRAIHVDSRVRGRSRHPGRRRRPPLVPVRLHDRAQAGRFAAAERENLRRFADAGGLLFSDDCNQIYRSFFTFAGGPPRTSHELNGWGDNLVHEYLRGIERRGRLAVLYSNKDYGCEWDYDWRNKRFLREDNTKFAVNVAVYVMA